MPWDIHPACADIQIVNAHDAIVRVTPPRRKVALVGFATNTLHLVPWYDPTFEIWGLNQGYSHMMRRGDRHFEMHQPEFTEDAREPDYLKFLSSLTIPVYMIDLRADIPASVRYPIEAAITLAGRDYFTSSISYMIALAMIEGFEEIHLYGINLAIGDEYAYEKPNAEWWIGMALGRGIRVIVPQASSLLKQFARYGYSSEPRPNMLTKKLLLNRINAYRAKCEELLRDYHVQLGAMREDEMLQQAIEGQEKGADIVVMQVPGPSTTT